MRACEEEAREAKTENGGLREEVENLKSTHEVIRILERCWEDNDRADELSNNSSTSCSGIQSQLKLANQIR